MKIIITEEQKKKLFVPRLIDERDKLFLKEIGMNPIIDYLKDNGEQLDFDMITEYNDWEWEIYVFDVNGEEIDEFKKPVLTLLTEIVSDYKGVFHVNGQLSINDSNELYVSFNYDFTTSDSDDKTYKL
jgi:hypothetical protein